MAYFVWSLLFQGLPLDHMLFHLGVANPVCYFCHEPENFMHVFWSCPKAKFAWIWIESFFCPFMPTQFHWTQGLLRDSIIFSEPLVEVWNIFRVTILFHISKPQNKIIFSSELTTPSFFVL